MNSTVPTIEIDYNRKCKRCGKPGAMKNGLCLKCLSKAFIKLKPNEKPQ